MAEYKIKKHLQPPQTQQTIHSIWKDFLSRTPGFVRTILPAETRELASDGGDSTQCEDGSYETARRKCILKVTSIVRECNRRNEMFTDPEFDILGDFDGDRHDCLFPLPIPEKPKESPWKDDEKEQKDKKSVEDTTGNGTFAQLENTSSGRQRGKTFDGRWIASVRRIHDIFDGPSLAPQASSKYIPSLDQNMRVWRDQISRWLVNSQRSLQILLAALCGARLLGSLYSDMFFASVAIICLLMAICRVAQQVNSRILGPQFNSSHISQGSL